VLLTKYYLDDQTEEYEKPYNFLGLTAASRGWTVS